MEKPKTTLSAQDQVILFCVAIEIGDSHLKDGKLSAGDGGGTFSVVSSLFLAARALNSP
jgi:hypothetical protein